MAEYDPIDDVFLRIADAAFNWSTDYISTAEFRAVVRDALVEYRNFALAPEKDA